MMLSFSDNVTNLIVLGSLWHLISDWLLQNSWMADNKASLNHPAAYVHSGIHLIGFLAIFPPLVALCIAVSHLLIDTRLPLEGWRKLFRQTIEGPVALHVAIWEDQVLHIAVIAVAAILAAIYK